MEITETVQCLIIGSGPAGYTAAIYASRAGLKPVLYQGLQPGGQLTITTEVENYPGYPEGIQGPDMMINFEKQAARMGADIRYGIATKVDFSGPLHKVQIDEDKWIAAHSIIISTGASAKWLGLESEQRLNGFGVSACAVCDGFFFKGKVVAIVGAGDTAAEEALYLSKICSQVHMIVRREEMRASKVMQARVINTPNITIHWNAETEEILGDTKVEGVRLVNNKTKEKPEIPVSAFFVAIGHSPNSAIFSYIARASRKPLIAALFWSMALIIVVSISVFSCLSPSMHFSRSASRRHSIPITATSALRIAPRPIEISAEAPASASRLCIERW